MFCNNNTIVIILEEHGIDMNKKKKIINLMEHQY